MKATPDPQHDCVNAKPLRPVTRVRIARQRGYRTLPTNVFLRTSDSVRRNIGPPSSEIELLVRREPQGLLYHATRPQARLEAHLRAPAERWADHVANTLPK